jgi:hypothetical protein
MDKETISIIRSIDKIISRLLRNIVSLPFQQLLDKFYQGVRLKVTRVDIELNHGVSVRLKQRTVAVISAVPFPPFTNPASQPSKYQV